MSYRMTVEVKSSDGHDQIFDAPGLDLWMRATDAGFVYVMATINDQEKALAIFFQPICAKFREVEEKPK